MQGACVAGGVKGELIMEDETKSKIYIAIWVLWFLFYFGGMALLVYVAWHFINKYW